MASNTELCSARTSLWHFISCSPHFNVTSANVPDSKRSNSEEFPPMALSGQTAFKLWVCAKPDSQLNIHKSNMNVAKTNDVRMVDAVKHCARKNLMSACELPELVSILTG